MGHDVEENLSREDVLRLWPELAWIQDPQLREKTMRCWERAFELSPLKPEDLNHIPFTLLIPILRAPPASTALPW